MDIKKRFDIQDAVGEFVAAGGEIQADERKMEGVNIGLALVVLQAIEDANELAGDDLKVTIVVGDNALSYVLSKPSALTGLLDTERDHLLRILNS